MDIHLIVDNDCTHKHAKVRAWLAQRPLSDDNLVEGRIASLKLLPV
jgi:hypothetical protein